MKKCNKSFYPVRIMLPVKASRILHQGVPAYILQDFKRSSIDLCNGHVT